MGIPHDYGNPPQNSIAGNHDFSQGVIIPSWRFYIRPTSLSIAIGLEVSIFFPIFSHPTWDLFMEYKPYIEQYETILNSIK